MRKAPPKTNISRCWGSGPRFKHKKEHGEATPDGKAYYAYNAKIVEPLKKGGYSYNNLLLRTPSFGIGSC